MQALLQKDLNPDIFNKYALWRDAQKVSSDADKPPAGTLGGGGAPGIVQTQIKILKAGGAGPAVAVGSPGLLYSRIVCMCKERQSKIILQSHSSYCYLVHTHTHTHTHTLTHTHTNNMQHTHIS